MKCGTSLILALVVGGLVVAGGVSAPARAAADKARITGLSDVSFGLISGTSAQSASQNVCAYSSSQTGGYSVTATGTGSGGAFAITSGGAELQYNVLWADAANQTGGTALKAGAPTPGFTSVASQQFCNAGPSTSASLTIVIPSASLSSAMAGSYSGTLQIMIAPE